jgi:hypothetical protein
MKLASQTTTSTGSHDAQSRMRALVVVTITAGPAEVGKPIVLTSPHRRSPRRDRGTSETARRAQRRAPLRRSRRTEMVEDVELHAHETPKDGHGLNFKR